MAWRLSAEDSTAAILYLASTLLELADAKRQMAEPVAEPEVQVPEENPVPCAPTRVEPEWQYVYQGTFTPSEKGMMIPACGRPTPWRTRMAQCETRLWMGPFNRADQPPLVEKTRDKVSGKTILVYEEIEGAPGVSAAATPAPEPVPEKFPEPALGSAFVPAPESVLDESPSESSLNSECASPTEVVLLEGDVAVTAAAVSETIPSGWTADVCSTTPSLKPEGLCDVLAAVMPTPLVVSTAVSDAPGGEVCNPSAIGAPVCCVPATEPLPEDLLDKLMSSSVNSADESILEVPAQIRCQSKRSVVSEPIKFVCPKVMVPQTPSEPGGSTRVAELYHYEWGKISLEGEKNLLAALPKLKDDNPLGPAPGWEEYEGAPVAEHGPGPPTEVPCSFIAPPIIGPKEEKDFWVLPGRADPNVFSSVSRVQRVINFHVHRKWGYFMPYAPLWVYEKVASSYENWLTDEILRKEKMHHSCLTNPDKVRREQDWQYLRSIEKEWWYGRTILQNAVKGCGKYNPTKNFNLEVYLGNGQWVDKPHPKYYIPYEDTKARFLHMI
ncbi:hypothetical protein XELAEV_18003504mg [Xenopus laevis]|nr:hypothetical protein XELAEV_18003504mg [Xenopus laevis]